jgi:hypothetical protein
MMAETYMARKRRILLGCPEADAGSYDTCVEFGYEPESWDGMWKLHPRVPIIPLSANWAVVIEATGRIRRNREVFRPRLVRKTASLQGA